MRRCASAEFVEHRLLKPLKRNAMRPQDRGTDIAAVRQHRKNQVLAADKAVSERLSLPLCPCKDRLRFLCICFILQNSSLRMLLLLILYAAYRRIKRPA